MNTDVLLALRRFPVVQPSSRRAGTRWSPLRVCASALTALALTSGARGASFYWTGDDNAFWNTPSGPGGTNWSSSPDFNNGTPGIPGTPALTDDVFFNLFGAGNLTTELGANFSINSLTFTGDATNAVFINDTPGTNSLIIGGGGVTVNGPSTYTINAALALGANQTWTNNNSANALLVNGVVSGAGRNLALGGNGGFVFTGANTYSGTTSLVSNGTSLTLSGANGSLATSGISLDGGTTLNLDNTTASNGNRIGDSVGITSKGGTVALKGGAATETLGAIALSTGMTRVNVDAGAVLTLGGAGLTRSAGGSVNFSTTGTINIAGISNINGVIGGHATIGNVGLSQQDAAFNGNVLDFASADPTTHNIAPFTAYDLNDFTASTKNTKVDGTTGVITLNSGVSTSINSLYLTGAAQVTIGTVGTTTSTLVIGTGGIISNSATLTLGGSGPQIDLANSAELGSGVVNGNNTAGGANTGIVTSATGDLVVTTASNLRIDALIANNGGTVVSLTKNGSGTLDLSDGNGTTATSTYTGITTINGGLVTIRNDRNLGAIPSINTANSITLNGGELRMTATTTLDSHRGITVGPQGGTISYNGGNTTNLSAFQVTGTGAITYSNIPGFGGVSANLCATRLSFPAGANNYQGGTTFFTQGSTNGAAISSVIFFANSDLVPDNSAVTVTNNDGKGILNLFGKSDTWGSLAGNGNILNGVATASALTVGGNNSSTTYSGSLGKTGVTWAVGANSTTGGDNTTGSTPAISLTKVGTGTLTMGGANQYTGATTINGGTLLVTGSLAGTAVAVGNGTLTGALGGSGTIGGAVTVSATGHLAPAITPTSISTLTINNNLTVSAGATLDFNFGAAGATGASDSINITGAGNLVLNAGTDVLNITQIPGSGFGIGTYKLLTNSGSGGFTDNAIFTINGKTNFNYAILKPGDTIDASAGGGTVPAKQLWLEVLQGNPNLTWIGGINGTWDINITANWTGDNTVFTTGANVTFDDFGIARPNITVTAGGVTPNSIVFANSAGNYTIGGGPITVTAGAGVTKSQSANVTLNSNVTTPITTINSGTMTVGAGAAYNSTAKVDLVGGSLVVNGTLSTLLLNVKNGTLLNVAAGGALGSSTALTVSGTGTANFNNASQTIGGLSGTGTVNLNGTALSVNGTSVFDGTLAGAGASLNVTGGSLTLSNGANSYTGATTVSNGTLLVTNTSGSATNAGLVTVSAPATLGGSGRVGGSVVLNGHLAPGVGGIGTINVGGGVTINAGGVLDYEAAALGSNDTASITGPLSLAGAETLNVTGLAGFTLGNYVLATAAGGVTNGATFTINATGGLPNYLYSVFTQGNKLLLKVDASSLVWKGAVDNNWDFTTANWSPTNPYTDSFRAVFDDTGANPGVNIGAPVSPFGVLFANNTVAYSMNGAAIGGSGSLTVSGTGLVTLNNVNTYTGGTVINNGTLSVSVDGNLGDPAGAVTINGGTLATSTTFALSATRTVNVGSSSGKIGVAAGTILTVAGVVADVPDQAGVLANVDVGELDLNGANTFSGGIDINAGFVRLNGVTSAGTGATRVNTGGALGIAANISTPVTLAGGVVGVTGAARTVTGDFTAAAGTTTTIDVYDPIAGNTANDFILTSTLHGSGNLSIVTVNAGQPDAGPGFRLRGPTSPDFTGNIIVGNSVKFELQSNVGSGSQMGTGTLILNGGTTSNTNAGTFSLVNVRNNNGGDINFGNNVQVIGSGSTYFNLLGSAPGGSSVIFGDLLIGDQQAVGAVATGSALYTVAFTTVHFTGGNVTFTPHPVGNANYVSAENIQLGPISESTPTGLTANGNSTLTLAAANNYSGSTTVASGTLVLGAAGALPAASDLIVNGGTVDLNNGGNSNDQTAHSLAGTGGAITNSDAANLRTLTVNQSSSTLYSGALTGNLTLTKTGTGTLAMDGPLSFVALNANGGTTTLVSALPNAIITNNAGTLNINADAFGSIVTVKGATNFGSSQTLSSLTIGAGGVATLTAHTGGPAGINAIDTSGLTIIGNGKLDLTNNAIVVRGGDEVAITAKVASGFDGGLWDGPGINSSTAAADPNFRTGVAVVNNADLGYTDFAGVTGLTGSEILLKYTYFGDSDLSGTVTSDDFGLFLDGYNHVTPPKWVNGDYDYSGTVTSDDFGLFIESFNNQGGALRDPGLAARLDAFAQQIGADGSSVDSGSAGTVAAGQAVVPEPGSVGLLAVGALGLLGRRTRRRPDRLSRGAVSIPPSYPRPSTLRSH